MARKKIDWTLHGDEIVSLYNGGLSTREISRDLSDRYGMTYARGTLTNFLGRLGIIRSQAMAHSLVHAARTVRCEGCGSGFKRASYNQRWCNDCVCYPKYKRRLRAHGLTAKQLEAMLSSQKGCCALCDRYFEDGLVGDRRKTLHIDHDHLTERVRGLLCPRCNMGMHFIDNRDWCQRALAYAGFTREEVAEVAAVQAPI